MAEQVGLYDLQPIGDRADPGAQQDAGQQAGQTLKQIGRAVVGVGAGMMGGRHDAASSAPSSDRSNG
ncbi:hypothetical protein D3C87_1812990 [compost metagenome]